MVTKFYASGYPFGITAGSDGNLWFTERYGNKIGRITTAGVITEFPVASGSYPYQITAGPDGNIWFTEALGNRIGRITPAGVITEFPIPTSGGACTYEPCSLPYWITTGPDGNLWFTEAKGNKIVKVVIYGVCLLYDPTKAVKSPATVPIKLQLCNGNGNNLSSPSLTLFATSITQVSTDISGSVQDSGNSNPDFNFRYDSTLGSSGGYIFNFSTKGLATGSYTLNFTVTGDSSVYTAPFQVK